MPQLKAFCRDDEHPCRDSTLRCRNSRKPCRDSRRVCRDLARSRGMNPFPVATTGYSTATLGVSRGGSSDKALAHPGTPALFRHHPFLDVTIWSTSYPRTGRMASPRRAEARTAIIGRQLRRRPRSGQAARSIFLNFKIRFACHLGRNSTAPAGGEFRRSNPFGPNAIIVSCAAGHRRIGMAVLR